MPNKRIRKKWLSRMRKDARRIAKRFNIPRQEVGWVLSGTIVDSTVRPDGVREITDLRLDSISLRAQAIEQALEAFRIPPELIGETTNRSDGTSQEELYRKEFGL